MKRAPWEKFSERDCVKLALGVIDQAIADLNSIDTAEREDAERFLFGPYTLPLEHWLMRAGCTDVAEFQYTLKRKLKRKLEFERKAA